MNCQAVALEASGSILPFHNTLRSRSEKMPGNLQKTPRRPPTSSQSKVLPGAGLTPYGIYLLGRSFEDAGNAVMLHQKRPFSDHPARLLFLHAIETFLRAYLRLHGVEPAELRAYMHDTQKMLIAATAKGLVLDPRTVKYVAATSDEGDYVRVRYDYDLRSLSDTWPDVSARPRRINHLVSAVAGLRVAVRDVLRATGIEA